MKATTRLHDEFKATVEDIRTNDVARSYSRSAETFDNVYPHLVVVGSSAGPAKLPFDLSDFIEPEDLVAEIQATPEGKDLLADAGAWVAKTFYPGEQSLKTLRLRTGLTQAQLAAEVGTSQSHIARIESGGCRLHLDTAARLSSALGIDMNEFNRCYSATRNASASK